MIIVINNRYLQLSLTVLSSSEIWLNHVAPFIYLISENHMSTELHIEYGQRAHYVTRHERENKMELFNLTLAIWENCGVTLKSHCKKCVTNKN